MRDAFDLDPAVTHLNHGSFGAVPRVVAEEQRRWRDRAEANPMRFHRVEIGAHKARARSVAADFLDVGADEVALLSNVTQAIATVLSGLAWQRRLGADDVVVVDQQGYESVRRSVEHWCERTGASYVVVPSPVAATPTATLAAFRERFAEVQRRGDRVRLVVIDHISSPTGAVRPVAEVCAAAHEVGALTFVDAAHVPGQLGAPPAGTGADFWAGTWHKWGFAPRGSSALWVAEAERDAVLPLTTSWNHGAPYPLPFDTHGTDDYSAWFALAAAVDFWRETGGLDRAVAARDLLDAGAAAVRSVLPSVEAAGPLEQGPFLRLVPLPDGVADTTESAALLYEALSGRGVEAQVVAYDGRGWIRLSAAPYNEVADYEHLAEVLPSVLGD
ncbi:aminotransferase class V-fold PLP-dependent enzyme [Nocardioides mesophilus]|uniref:Aminotransferase class V-fold PLP-dependent enzyme n=1 Tax=Nocardioides mesophilus TaxID=433659 RepID=A0A7G9RDW9_9ACTN|nr:aminotransferase class V-fold PLP-dependent enzyme [Nocardioides mesophilus]QNN53794.1 aminotransferase class V-fold PLP-dependent enzyme [Nocardioides mesophilus]